MSKCIFRLRRECVINNEIPHESRYGDEKFVKVYCAMCVKSLYARARYARAKKDYVVVNTL